ncbi:hypothetical protein HQ585_10055 [candidate division KSB1 bacterium]|nr:hypothetical protein [candidate division KSB1 bacterium]
MASTGQKWLIGCGIGCGAVILIIVLLVGGSFLLVKNTVQDFKAVEAITEQLEAEYGTVESYCPPADGVISIDRIEQFIAIRDSMLVVSEDIAERVDELSENIDRLENDDVKSFKDVFKLISKGAGVVPQLADYYLTRNQALLANEMGTGEYFYLYITIYYSYLGHDPGDGPQFKLMDNKHRRRGVNWNTEDDDDLTPVETIENRREWVTTLVRDLMLPMLECQMESLQQSGHADNTWKNALAREIQALHSDPDRLVWQDGLPRTLTQNLSIYRDELDSRYDAMLNPLEVMAELDDN